MSKKRTLTTGGWAACRVAVFVGLLGWGVVGALVSLIVAAAMGLTAILVVLRCKHGLTWAWPSGAQLNQVLSFGVRYYFGKISNLLNVQLGTLMLAFFASKDDIGLFASPMLLDRTQLLPDTLTTVLYPRVAADEKGRVELVAQCSRRVIVASGVALAAAALLAQPVFSMVLPKYLPAVVLIWILAPGVWIRCASKLLVPYLHSQKRVGIASVAVVVGAAVNLGILLALLRVIGRPAAALAVVGNYLVSSAILAVAFARRGGLSIWQAWCPRWSDLVWLRQECAAYVRAACAGSPSGGTARMAAA